MIPEISAERLSRQIALRFAEPSCFQTESSFPLWNERPTLSGLSSHGGDDGIRTHDPLLAGQVLSQLSYTPKLNAKCKMQNAKSFRILLFLRFFSLRSGLLHSFDCVSIELSSRTVSRKVFSPLQSLTSVFGMGTGGPSAFVALTFILK